MKDNKKQSGWSWGRWLLVGAVLVAVVIVVAIVTSRRDNHRYEQMVRAFYVGVAALDAGDKDRALRNLTEATQIIPSEPAAWADLALAHMQLGNLEAAERALQTAERLAPQSAPVQVLWAALQNSQGRPELAVVHLERALQLDPSNRRTRYALAETLRWQDADQHEQRIVRLLDELAQHYPDNLLLLLERAEWAATTKDHDKLKKILATMKQRVAFWPEMPRSQLAATEKAFAKEDWSAATAREIRFLNNVLKPTADFKAGVAELVTPIKLVGEPVYEFLKLRNPPSTPAAADEGVSFQRKTISDAASDTFALLAPAIGETADPVLVAVQRERLTRLDPPAELATLPALPASDSAPEVSRNPEPSRNTVVAVDWSRDYRMDLVIAGGGLKILEQTDDGDFRDVTADTGLPPDVLEDRYFGVWAFDSESDGDMDLLLAPMDGPTRVLRNNSDGTFAVSHIFLDVKKPRAMAWADFDSDGAPDVALLDDAGTLHVFDNRRSGRFVPRDVSEVLPACRAMAVGDVDNDGRLELVLLTDNAKLLSLTDTGQGRGWRLQTVAELEQASAKVAPLEVGRDYLSIADLDNNGALDVAVSSGPDTVVLLHHNRVGLRRQPVIRDFRLTDVEDVDEDGRLDLLGVSGKREAVRMINKGTRDYHWQFVRPRALQKAENRDSRMNSFGIGSEIQIRSGMLTQKRVAQRPRVHFGLGERRRTDVARIVWPHGVSQAEFDLPVDATVNAEQRLIGSCPFLFAFDGESMEFVTDFLWRSPLGLRINSRDTTGIVQTEDWVKVRGDQLVARDGSYDLRITADLWETHFFDHVSLLVVDHAADVAVFVDERFCFPPPPLEVVATTIPQPLATVRDQNGRDVTHQTRSRDGDYVDGFALGMFQGVASEHWVEVELADEVPSHGPLVLVAQGFVYPTDSSINVSLSQGDHARPRGLVLEVDDGQGGWRLARDNVGFPSGKHKTILIDLEGVFVAGAPRRFRLRTNMEVYWDQLSWALKRPRAELRTRRLAAQRAELRYRGISRMHQAGRKRPDLPTYQQPRPAAGHWRDLVGFHTRLGDVRELLAEIDDRYVIMNAGDELAFRFDEVQAPASGWERDYVVIGDGWVKDGNLNTAFSRTVLPLPSHASADYTEPPTELIDDPVYQRFAEDWRTYHTRYVDPESFRRGLRPTGR